MSIQSPLVWQQEESETGFTKDKTYTYTNSNWNNQLNIIPAYSKITKVIARIRYRSSTGAGKFEFYVGGTKYASGTAPASSKEEEFDVTSKFITSGSSSGELNGEIKFRFYSSIIYKYQLGFVRLTWTYDTPVFVVYLSKTGEGTVSGAGTYDIGTTATIKAIPADGYKFVKWSDENASATRTVTLANGKQTAYSTTFSYNAVFEPLSMWEYKVLSEPDKTCYITKYNGSDTEVVVPSTIDGYTVVRLGYRFHGSLSDTADFDSNGNVVCTEDTTITGSPYYGTFAENTKIQKVTVPSTIRWIGYQTFRNCSSLLEIDWSTKQTCVVGRTSFYNCTSLTMFALPEKIAEVYDYAFQDCSGLTDIAFPNENVKLKSYVSSDSAPTHLFRNTSDSLMIWCYHQTYETYSEIFSEKNIWYYDAIITFVSDGAVVQRNYIPLGASPLQPLISKDGYVLVGWNDGTTTYTNGNLPYVKTDPQTGGIDVTYTAVWEKVITPPKITTVSMTYASAQISKNNKVPTGEGFLISVGASQ